MSHSQLLRNHFGSRLNSALSFADGRRRFVGLLSRSLIWIRQRLFAALGALPERANDLARCSARGRCTSGTREDRACRRLLGNHRRRVDGAHLLQRVRLDSHQAGDAAVRGGAAVRRLLRGARTSSDSFDFTVDVTALRAPWVLALAKARQGRSRLKGEPLRNKVDAWCATTTPPGRWHRTATKHPCGK